MSFKRLRYDWTTIEPGERVYNKIKEVRVYEDWTPTFTGGHCDLIFNSTARVGWEMGRPTPPEYSHGEWSTPGVCDEYTGRWEATANTNYGSYSMVKEFEVVEDCYVFARYDFTGSGSASYRHISVTINGSYAAEPGVDGTRKFSKGDRIRFTFVKTANPSAAAGDVAFVSMELPSYVEADVTPIGWTYYTLHWVGESGIGTKGEDVAVVHTAYLKDDKTNKRMIIPGIYVYCDDPTEHTTNKDPGEAFPINLDTEITHPFITLEFDAALNLAQLCIKSSTSTETRDADAMLRFRSWSWFNFAITKYDGVSGGEYEIFKDNHTTTDYGIVYHVTELDKTAWHNIKFVFNREGLDGYWYADGDLYGHFYGIVDVAANMKAIGLVKEGGSSSTIVKFKNLKVTGYSSLDSAMGD